MQLTINRKPTFPIGTTFLNSGKIHRAIFCVENYEVYKLQNISDTIWGIVIQCQTSEEAMDQRKKHLMWWELQTEDKIKVLACQILRQSGQYLILACLETPKENILFEAERTNILNQAQAESLMIDLLNVCKIAQANNFTPLIDIGAVLLFELNGAINAISFFIISPSSSNELDFVILIAKIVFYFSTGIEFTSVSSQKDSLGLAASRWNKNVNKKFSSLLARCLNKHATNRIVSFSNLELELGSILVKNESLLPSTHHANQKNICYPKSESPSGLEKVAGMKRLKAVLIEDVINPIRDPEPFKRYGLSIPNGILLYGPPGCGKTFIARQLTEELGWYFKEIKGSDIGSVYIHGTVLAIRDLFTELEENAPAMVFIDEFEGLVPKRSELSGIQQYKSEEVNEFLVHLNECAAKRIFIIAATNEPYKIDEAILRPGRLDKMIFVEPPDFEARIELLKMYLSHRPLANFQFEDYAQSLEGYSCVDIRHLADEAARLALKEGKRIDEKHIKEAIRRNPSSLSADILSKYENFKQRGI